MRALFHVIRRMLKAWHAVTAIPVAYALQVFPTQVSLTPLITYKFTKYVPNKMFKPMVALTDDHNHIDIVDS